MRTAHILRSGKQFSTPYQLVYVDTETTNEDGEVNVGKHTLSFGVSIYTEYKSGKSTEIVKSDRLKFNEPNIFFDWLVSLVARKRTVWVIAHNWNFDAGILSLNSSLIKRGFELGKYINGRPPVIIDYSDAFDRRLKIIDSLNYFITSLKGLGESVGIEKLEMPSPDDTQAMEIYAWRDVEIVQSVIDKFRTFVIEHSLGKMKETLAGQAYVAFKTRFMEHDIYCHDRERILTLERNSYHGGRTESFYKGTVEHTLYKLDINSHYPAEMYQRRFPTRIVIEDKASPDTDRLQEYLDKGYALMASCRVNTPLDVFAFRASKLIFPIGEFDTVLTTPEIEFALEYNLIVDVTHIVVYNAEPIFREYVDYFYQRRMEFKALDDDAFSYMSKILLNSLYGKFGQRGRRWETYNGDGLGFWQSDETSPVRQIRFVGELKQILSVEPESHESVPIIASEVTAAGRITLYRYILLAGFQNCYYADTDSLIVNQDGYDNLEHLIGSELGQLKLEEQSEHSIFVAPKHYFFNGKWIIKGVKKTAKWLSDNKLEQEEFTSWDVHFRRGEEGFIDIKKKAKTISGKNDKRILEDKSGWTTPITVTI